MLSMLYVLIVYALTWCCDCWPVYCSSLVEIAIGKNCLLMSPVALLLMNDDHVAKLNKGISA